jgi:hypothetical protein
MVTLAELNQTTTWKSSLWERGDILGPGPWDVAKNWPPSPLQFLSKKFKVLSVSFTSVPATFPCQVYTNTLALRTKTLQTQINHGSLWKLFFVFVSWLQSASPAALHADLKIHSLHSISHELGALQKRTLYQGSAAKALPESLPPEGGWGPQEVARCGREDPDPRAT